MKNQKIGVAMTGSFCTFSQVLPVIRQLARSNEVTVVLSPAAAETDTRFYRAEDLLRELEQITGRKPMRTIAEAEQVGPGKLFDVLLAAPCTGNTLAKLNLGITDTSVLMAIKAQLRNGRPVVLALSTNDALSNAAKTSAVCSTGGICISCPSARTIRRKSPAPWRQTSVCARRRWTQRWRGGSCSRSSQKVKNKLQ